MGAQQILLAAGGSGIDTLRLDAAYVQASGEPATASWRMSSDGGVYQAATGIAGGAWQFQYYWVQPAANAADYECTWDVGTGTVDSTPGAAGTWLALTSSRDWSETQASGATESASFTARLRLVGAGSDAKTAAIDLQVDGFT